MYWPNMGRFVCGFSAFLYIISYKQPECMWELIVTLCCVRSESDFAAQWTAKKHNNTSKEGTIHQQRHWKDYFQEWWPRWHWSSLHERRWKEANRWCLSDVGTDYLISLSNWPESCCCCFASAELTYLNLISVHKSIWGFVFISVSWECSRKCKRLIHKSVA